MLNNKKTFDVITPMNKFHRMSKRVAANEQYLDVDIEPGMWVKLTKDGVMGTKSGTGQGYSALCLNTYKIDNPYEGHDTADNITVVIKPGVVCRAGSFYFKDTLDISTLVIGDPLAVMTGGTIDDKNIGKLDKAGSGDLANAVVIDVTDEYIEYMIITPKVIA